MIGISLGRFSFSVAVFSKGIVANPHGSRTTPTRVALSEGSKPVVGESAVQSSDEIDSSHPQFWHCVLAYAKEIAMQVEHDLSVIVIAAPIELIPTIRAIEKNALVIDSALAALLAYDLDENAIEQQSIAVFDYADQVARWTEFSIPACGLISQAADLIEIQLPSLTDRLVSHFGQEFYRKTKADFNDSRRAMRKLRNASVEVKHRLSAAPQSSLELDSFFEGIDFFTNITRAKFEMLVDDVLAKACDVSCNRPDVAVVLVGGGCKVPRVRQLIKSSNVLGSIPSDEVCALGAAKQASILASIPAHMRSALQAQRKDVVLSSFELGFVLDGDYCAVIEPDVMLPVRRQFTISNASDDQDSIKLQFSVRPRIEGDDQLGEPFAIGQLVHRFAPKKKQSLRFEVTVDIDETGKISVKGSDRAGGSSAIRFEYP